MLNLVFEGDGIVAGDYGRSYADRVTPFCYGSLIENKASSVAGIVDLFNRIPATQSGTQNILVVGSTTADLLAGMSPADYIKALRSYCRTARSIGWTVIVSSVLPRSDVAAGVAFENIRIQMNTKLRAEWWDFGNDFIDFAADPRMGVAGVELNMNLYADRWHPTDLGYEYLTPVTLAAIHRQAR